jgi:hypothetical protein
MLPVPLAVHAMWRAPLRAYWISGRSVVTAA